MAINIFFIKLSLLNINILKSVYPIYLKSLPLSSHIPKLSYSEMSKGLPGSSDLFSSRVWKELTKNDGMDGAIQDMDSKAKK
jgi:hypothetical protein